METSKMQATFYRRTLLFLLVLPLSSAFVVTRSTCHFLKTKTSVSDKWRWTTCSALLLFSTANNNECNESTLSLALDVAVKAAKRAGDIIVENCQGSHQVDTKSTSRDLLTLIDPLCEKAIRQVIQESSFSNHDILGEEQVAPGMDAAIAALEEKLANPKAAPWLFIVDPIDGTTNFASGIPLCMPSIAVAYQGEVMVGVLYDPFRQELYTAIRGQGAKLNGKIMNVHDSLSPSTTTSLENAVIGMESPAGQDSLEQCVDVIPSLMPKVRTIRMLGSSALMLPWVAKGRLTGYWTPDESAWDIAAGALIVQEAGGKVTDLYGNDYTLRTRSLVASNGNIHDALLQVLQDALRLN